MELKNHQDHLSRVRGRDSRVEEMWRDGRKGGKVEEGSRGGGRIRKIGRKGTWRFRRGGK